MGSTPASYYYCRIIQILCRFIFMLNMIVYFQNAF